MFQEFTGMQYLKIDIANTYGLDKLDWDERLAWFDANEASFATMIFDAKEPALFYAGIKTYYAAQKGEAIGYMISLDATASGLQLLAVLTGDRLAAQLCNVVDTGKRQNAYSLIYNEMCFRIGDNAKITAEQSKDAVMTSLYGSKAVPKRVFGEGQLLTVFYDTMQDLAPAAWELNEAFLGMWDSIALEHSWVLPDNYHVHIKVMDQVKETVHFLNEPFDIFYKVNQPVMEGRSLGANSIHSVDGMLVREMTRRCNYNPKVTNSLRAIIDQGKTGGTSQTRKMDRLVIALWENFQKTGYMSARILDYLDASNIGLVDPKVILDLLESLPGKPFEVIAIHDCFRCLPHYGNDLRRQYTLQLHLIAKSTMLQDLVSQIVGGPVSIGKMDQTLHHDILEANYALS